MIHVLYLFSVFFNMCCTLAVSERESIYLNEFNENNRRRWPPRSSNIQKMQQFVTSRPNHLPPIDYGDNHPFNSRTNNDNRSLQTIKPNKSRDERYKQIRIKYEFTNLLNRGTHDDEERIRVLKENVLPAMGNFYKHLLSVIPVEGYLPINSDECFGYVKVPNVLKRMGIKSADLLIFVAAFESVDGNALCGDGVLAAASPCGLDQFDRPITGFINFCLDEIPVHSSGKVKQSDIQNLISVGIHEFAHVLGMNGESWKFFRHPLTGEPMTERPFTKVNRVCVNGKKFKDVVIPSCRTIQEGKSSNGMPYFEIVTPTVRQVVRNQFGCQTLTGARLENQPTNEYDCFGTHWDERYFYADTLSAYYTPEADYFSALTLAVLEDSGWYKTNYTIAEASPFGHGAGCDFVEKKCIEKSNNNKRHGGKIPQFGLGYFCDNPVRQLSDGGYKFDYTCDPSHKFKAGCDLLERSELTRLPKEGRYFTDKNYGVFQFYNADYCPIAQIDTRDCRNQGNNNRFGKNYPGEVYGPNSLCYDTTILHTKGNLKTSICLQSNCNPDTQRLEVEVGGTTLICQFDFQGLGFRYQGSEIRFICPRLLAACPRLFCPSNCSGRGICNYNTEYPHCECFDPNDKSPACFNSPAVIENGDYDDRCSSSKTNLGIFVLLFTISITLQILFV